MDISKKNIETKNSKNKIKLVNNHIVICKQVNIYIIYIICILVTSC